MANAASISQSAQGTEQMRGVYKEMWTAKAAVSDQDAIADNDTVVAISLTVPGVALGDHVISWAADNNLVDGDVVYAFPTLRVTAANTVSLLLWVNAAFNADDLNGAVFSMVLGRPAF